MLRSHRGAPHGSDGIEGRSTDKRLAATVDTAREPRLQGVPVYEGLPLQSGHLWAVFDVAALGGHGWCSARLEGLEPPTF